MKPGIKKVMSYSCIVMDVFLCLIFISCFMDEPEIIWPILALFPLMSIYLHVDHLSDIRSKAKMTKEMKKQVLIEQDRENIQKYYRNMTAQAVKQPTDVSDVQDLYDRLNGEYSVDQTQEGKELK